MTVGYVHSMESMGLVDGPGIRSVVFLQGCSLRCQFCHNPDTWDYGIGEKTTPEDLVKKIARFKPYFKKDGGITFSGGEPLMQPAFLLECLKLCKAEDIHTCIDTAGFGQGDYDEILKYTDLVLLDVKHTNEKDYKNLTGQPMDSFFGFLKALKRNGSKIWIRHVVIPGITDSKKHMEELQSFVADIPNVKKAELLPYHLLGENKYQVMGISYPLDGISAMDKETTKEMEAMYFGGTKTC